MTKRAYCRTPEESFAARTERIGDCLIWTGSRAGRGYGQIWVGEKMRFHKKFVAGAKWQREQLQDTEAVARLASFLFNDDHGETLDEHDKTCPIPNCGYRATYMSYARGALAALMGEDQ